MVYVVLCLLAYNLISILYASLQLTLISTDVYVPMYAKCLFGYSNSFRLCTPINLHGVVEHDPEKQERI